jgi:glycosyltransferase involved in cell wall biosynthesis
VIPTWNRAALLVRALRSVLAQTVPDLEAVVVDDGSTDDTRAAVSAVDDARIVLVTLPRRQGPAAARNHGIRRARADLVAFLDSDDEWRPRMLEATLERLARSDHPRADVVYCGWDVWDAQRGRAVPPAPEDAAAHEGDVFERLLAGWQPRSTSGVAVRRNALLEVGGFDESLPAWVDMDLWLRLAQAGHRFLAVPEPLIVKHEHTGPQVMTDPDRQSRALAAFEAKWRTVWRERPRHYRRWRAKRAVDIQYAHFTAMAEALGGGDRRRARAHWTAICRQAWWAPRLAAQASALLMLGPWGYRTLTRGRRWAAGPRE